MQLWHKTNALQDSHISDVYASGDTMYAVSTYFPARVHEETGCSNFGGVSLKNVVIENIFYSGCATHSEKDWLYTYLDQEFSGYALDFRCLQENDTFTNTIFRNIFTDAGQELVMVADGVDYQLF